MVGALATLPLRILEYARAHLHDPHLGAAQVAAAHHISERHLYNILGASGIILADWVRTQRLERCRNDIAASAFHATPIASIARGWGFGDPRPRASSSISSAHRLHNTVQGPHGRLIRAPGTVASS
jgi:AraC-like DNA-binding protein